MHFLCWFGLHSWPRVQGGWRNIVTQPCEAECRRCDKPLSSIWRSVYPKDGSSCRRSCQVHVPAKARSRFRLFEPTQAIE